MAIVNIPTSKEIYIEINGQKIAVAQSYKVKTTRDSRFIEAFGATEPVCTIAGRTQYQLDLTRLLIYTTLLDDDVDFYSLSDFNVVIVKPDKRIIYSGCEWSAISETAELSQGVVEQVTVLASKRLFTM